MLPPYSASILLRIASSHSPKRSTFNRFATDGTGSTFRHRCRRALCKSSLANLGFDRVDAIVIGATISTEVRHRARRPAMVVFAVELDAARHYAATVRPMITMS